MVAGEVSETLSPEPEENLSATVLVVDDEPNIVTLLETWLETIGCKVVSADDGEKGVEKAREVLPDLILMDGMMPRMSGFEACRSLKSEPSTKDIPVIFLTVQNEVQDVVRGLELGAHGYMTKPFKPQELLARVRSTLKIKQIQDRLKAHTKTLKLRWDWMSGAIETLPAGLLVFDCETKEQLFCNSRWRELLALDDHHEEGLVSECYNFFQGEDADERVLESDEELVGLWSLSWRGQKKGDFAVRAASFVRGGRSGRQLLIWNNDSL